MPNASSGSSASSASLYSLLHHWTKESPDAIALGTPGGRSLSYRTLLDEVDAIRARLNALGIGREDRVSVVLPNGLEMAVAFLGVASAATCAPLNPGYRAAEFEFYLSDLGAKCLVVQDLTSPAVEVARKLKISVVTLRPTAAPRLFELDGEAIGAATRPGIAEGGDIGLVLHTSGTTARPKIVPLTQNNLRPRPRTSSTRSDSVEKIAV